jgi:Chemotaxis protein histidine kinase and related kinases
VDFEFDELKREFLAEAEEKVQEIQVKASGPRTAESLDRLIYLAHQLKGAGGSYGFQAISTEAAGLEKAVEQLVGGEPAAPLESVIERHVLNLRAEVEKRTLELSTKK